MEAAPCGRKGAWYTSARSRQSPFRTGRSAIPTKPLVAAAVLAILGLSGFAVAARLAPPRHGDDPVTRIDPRIRPDDGYVGSGTCVTCHPYQHATWDATYHRAMTQVATPRAVLAPFDGTVLHLEGVTWRLERRGDAFWVTGTEPIAGTTEIRQLRKRIVMTTGSHNYQLYWMEGDIGADMSPFPLVYLLYDGVWIPRKSRFLVPPVERTPVETGRWSVHCIKCHATHGQPHRDGGGTRVAELGIACEACHGPGARHAGANRDPVRRFELYAGDDADTTIVNPKRLRHDRASQVCGQCHGIEIFLDQERAREWQRKGMRFRPGDDLFASQTLVSGRYEDNPPAVQAYIDNHAVFRLRNCFWPDGMLRVAGREYHGMLETPCYQRGDMSCLSCHRLHRPRDDARTLKAWADDQLDAEALGDGACVKCHQQYEPAAARTAHTHHAADSPGSRCYNCHMPYTTWGLLRAIRSHTVDSPEVGKSVATGRPGACNQCHLDRTLQWTADNLKSWYGIEPPALSEEQKTVSASVLWTLSGDAVQRALMSWSMGWAPAREASGTDWMVPYLCKLLDDPYDAVRFRAQRSLGLYPEFAALTADSVQGATRERQEAMGGAILAVWERSGMAAAHDLPALLLPDGRLDRTRFARLAARRDDQDLLLFE